MAVPNEDEDDGGQFRVGFCQFCRAHGAVRTHTISRSDQPTEHVLCPQCAVQLTWVWPRDAAAAGSTWSWIVQLDDGSCFASPFRLEELWYWPTTPDGLYMTGMPHGLWVWCEPDALPPLTSGLVDVAHRLARDKWEFIVTAPTLHAIYARQEIQRLLLNAVPGSWTRHWYHPSLLHQIAGYRSTFEVVRREEEQLPGVIMCLCGFPAELAALVYSYRRPLYHVAQHEEAVRKAGEATKLQQARETETRHVLRVLRDDLYTAMQDEAADQRADAIRERLVPSAVAVTTHAVVQHQQRSAKRQRVA